MTLKQCQNKLRCQIVFFFSLSSGCHICRGRGGDGHPSTSFHLLIDERTLLFKDLREKTMDQQPMQEMRSASQSTFIVSSEKPMTPVSVRTVQNQPNRKRSVILDYEPDRGGGMNKKRTDKSPEVMPSMSHDRGDVRRLVDNSSGRVVKISVLGEYQGSILGKCSAGTKIDTFFPPHSPFFPASPAPCTTKRSDR